MFQRLCLCCHLPAGCVAQRAAGTYRASEPGEQSTVAGLGSPQGALGEVGTETWGRGSHARGMWAGPGNCTQASSTPAASLCGLERDEPTVALQPRVGLVTSSVAQGLLCCRVFSLSPALSGCEQASGWPPVACFKLESVLGSLRSPARARGSPEAGRGEHRREAATPAPTQAPSWPLVLSGVVAGCTVTLPHGLI